jgi:hypothetical protein
MSTALLTDHVILYAPIYPAQDLNQSIAPTADLTATAIFSASACATLIGSLATVVYTAASAITLVSRVPARMKPSAMPVGNMPGLSRVMEPVPVRMAGPGRDASCIKAPAIITALVVSDRRSGSACIALTTHICQSRQGSVFV